MEQDAEETAVVMRRWRSGSRTVIALFPYVVILGTGGAWLVSSYEHIGQHGPADYGAVIRATRPADWGDPDVAALRRELEGAGFGYRLAPRKRINWRTFNRARNAERGSRK